VKWFGLIPSSFVDSPVSIKIDWFKNIFKENIENGNTDAAVG